MKHLFQRVRHSGIVQMAVKIGITLLVFWAVFRGIDFARLEAVLHHQEHPMLAVGAGLLFAQMLVGAFRWYLIVHALSEEKHPKLGKRPALKIYYISMFFTCCLPGAVGGDVMRVWLTKSEHLPLNVTINSVIIDRMAALAALVLMVIFTLPVLGKSLGLDPSVVLPLAALSAVTGLWFLFNAERFLKPVRHVRIVHWILHLVSSIHMIIKNPYTCCMVLILAFIGQCIYALAAWVLAISLHVDMTLLQSLTLMPPVMLATTLPISIGGWGVREASIIGMLSIIGVAQVSALALSLELGLLGIFISLPGSLLWLAHRRAAV